jgi:hypothetical protein
VKTLKVVLLVGTLVPEAALAAGPLAAALVKISGLCDGVRCDMAMLVLPDVFERTWGRRAPPFWPKATQRVRERVPGFCFMAEVYWDLEWTMPLLRPPAV